MQIDALAVRLRPRTPMEAADLGVRLCQHAARDRSIPAICAVAVPLIALALASYEIATWLPGLLIWWSKPWLDRTILFVLSRAAFGQRTTPVDVWRAQRQVWWRQLLFTLDDAAAVALALAHASRSISSKGSRSGRRAPRVRQIRRRAAGSAFDDDARVQLCRDRADVRARLAGLLVRAGGTGARSDRRSSPESCRASSCAGASRSPMRSRCCSSSRSMSRAGFAMYLNRRAELEAWDIEQEFRRAFAHDRFVRGGLAVALC